MNQYTLPQVWEGVKKQVDYAAKQQEVEEFNRSHAWLKRGVAMTPTRYSPSLCLRALSFITASQLALLLTLLLAVCLSVCLSAPLSVCRLCHFHAKSLCKIQNAKSQTSRIMKVMDSTVDDPAIKTDRQTDTDTQTTEPSLHMGQYCQKSRTGTSRVGDSHRHG